ncbi:MFS transporter [Rickettsia endosymbiont of Cardiosporidium cionae]|uniref:MFS transporter n=1 Tax=Rickettsia endosymbiont of Cardiosporidium cionae TaxID=2777155 RepID=UPI0018953232|nr:MFS transporter [Rickettsia endosymbiont of Cardiosporidium cionae]KAF8818295.1 MFS transporter [Rickettsia endosymbiont of Cardiosporidium cionae]
MINKKKYFTIFIYGVFSGFTLMITGNTLNFWLTCVDIDIKSIGLISIITLPYAVSFIWAPILDRIRIEYLDYVYKNHYVRWLLVIAVCLTFTILIISYLDPQHNIYEFAFAAFLVAFFSSTKDIILNTLRSILVHKQYQLKISGIYIFGYRVGMILSGSGAIYLSSSISWFFIYKIFTIANIIFSIIVIFLSKDIECKFQHFTENSYAEHKEVFFLKIYQFCTTCINSFTRKKNMLYVLLIIFLYRLPDNLIGVVLNKFFYHELGYSISEIAIFGKFYAVIGVIIGGLIASSMIKKSSIKNALLRFGMVHTLSHLLLIIQHMLGKNLLIYLILVTSESITSGMAMCAYIAYITSMCSGRFVATQSAFLFSFMGLSRSIVPTVTGYILVATGWRVFYLLMMLLAIPSLLIIKCKVQE